MIKKQRNKYFHYEMFTGFVRQFEDYINSKDFIDPNFILTLEVKTIYDYVIK